MPCGEALKLEVLKPPNLIIRYNHNVRHTTMTTRFGRACAKLVSQTQDDVSDDESYSSIASDYRAIEKENIPRELKLNSKSNTKGKYRKLNWVLWSDGGEEYYYTEEDLDDALWCLAAKEFGGQKANGVFFIKGPKRETKSKKFRTWQCPYYNCSGCKAAYQTVYWKEENRWQIQVATNTSHDHEKNIKGCLKDALVACVTSPSKLSQRPKSLVGKAVEKTGTKLTQRQQESLKRCVGRLRVKNATKHLMNGGDGTHYGDVVENLLRKYKRDNIKDFNRDSVYLLGDDVCVDVMKDKEGNDVLDDDGRQTVRFYCVLSTENLLLNGPRQLRTGQHMVLAVDGSYRYVIEKDHGLFIVKTINHSQSARTIAYAICNREDKPALTWIFSAIKAEIERVVNGLINNGIEYM